MKALAAAPDGTPVATLRLPKGRAQALADMLRDGVFRWKRRRLRLDKVELRIEIEKGRSVVRREVPSVPAEPVVEPSKKRARRAK